MDRIRNGLWKVGAFVLAGLTALPVVAGEVTPGPLEGLFVGTSADRQEVTLRVVHIERSIFAEGTLAEAPLLLSGAESVCGVGALEGWRESGELVAFSLSADGQTLKIERQGAAELLLERQDPGKPLPPPGESGPMTGDWVAQEGDAVLAEVALVERHEMIAGIAMVLGDAVAVTGRIQNRGPATGVVTFVDGSQMAFTAELSADGSTLTVEGFGTVVKLSRRGAP